MSRLVCKQYIPECTIILHSKHYVLGVKYQRQARLNGNQLVLPTTHFLNVYIHANKKKIVCTMNRGKFVI